MRSRRNGLFTTLTTLILISAIPLFAIFGIPHFVPVVASPSTWDDYDIAPHELSAVQGESPRRSASELFAPFPHKHRPDAGQDESENGDKTLAWEDPFQSSRTSTQSHTSAMDGWAVGLKSGRDERSIAETSREQHLTWRRAVQRLNEHGIRQFRLQPGQREDEFHFSCSFTPGDNPRITHRFEAEATEPLIAVQKVLDQIAEWTRAR